MLLYGQRVLNSPTLTLPHPRMHQRRFVLEPLAEVAPALAIPHAGPLGTLLTQVAAQVVERCDGPEEWLSALARNRPTTPVG